MGRFAWLTIVLIACDATPTFDAGPNDAGFNDATVDACFAYCQPSGTVPIMVECGKVVDASAGALHARERRSAARLP